MQDQVRDVAGDGAPSETNGAPPSASLSYRVREAELFSRGGEMGIWECWANAENGIWNLGTWKETPPRDSGERGAAGTHMK